ncbi:hypothetical protein F5Y14DRAFT_449540 [Nemania sp. NC0429]|nr:hypothetical protein F5Y14DRAFT_449540 [Nemania sp. NC0429]
MSASHSHPKPSRSRFSSPHRRASSPVGHGRGGGGHGDGARTFMQRWLEPPVQVKPSFQDAGLVRAGVVENMAPLGTFPKAAQMKKTPLLAEKSPLLSTSTVKRIVLKKPYSPASVGAAVLGATTPDATAAVDAAASDATLIAASIAAETSPGLARRPRSDSAGMMEAGAGDVSLSPTSRLTLPLPVVDDMDDDDYVPKKSKARRNTPISTRANASANTSANTSTYTPTHAPAHVSAHVSANTSALPHPRRQSHRHRSVHSSPAPPILEPTPDPTLASTSLAPTSPTRSEILSAHQPAREPDDKERADKVVELAVEEALRHFRYPTAWALRLLYDEHSGDPHFVSMIEDVYYQRATPKTIRKFRRLIYEKKKEGKEDNKGCYYFVPPSTGNLFTPHKPRPASYKNLIKMDFASALRDSAGDVKVDADGHVNKKRRTEKTENLENAEIIEKAKQIEETEETANKENTEKAEKPEGAGQRMTPSEQPSTPLRLKISAPTDNAGPHSRRNGGHHRSRNSRGGTAKNRSSRGKKTRSDSVSSSSSLSSVPDDAIEDYDDFLESVDGDTGTSRMEDEHGEGNNAQAPAGSVQPISVEQAKPAIKKQIISPDPAPEQNTPTTHHPRSRDSSMPAAAITTSTTATITTTNGTLDPHANQPVPTLKFPSRFGDFDDSADAILQKKRARKAETTVNTQSASVESFVREPIGPDELPDEPDSLPQLPAPPPERARLSRTPAPALSSRATRAAKRNHDEFDDASSPTISSFRADFELSSARNSRAATPTHPRSSKKSRGGLRVKTSPMKKKGTSAGIPRGNGERPSPVGNGGPSNQDDNDDSCFTCGGNGELVCCDGCAFSFHFVCIDPPMDQGHIPDEWFCNECQIRYNPPLADEHKGIFGPLVANLQRKNPRAFRLPESIRDYFEGVKTGAEGEYEEAAPPKPKTTKKNAEEAFDFFKLRNGDKAVLCHHCHKGVTDNRPIIPCSVCGLNWHLECLDPPLAVPPILRTWRCPCHVDDLLGNLPERLAPAHKYRKIKNMPEIKQAYSRGLSNNGWIEIEDDDSEDDDEATWRQGRAFGRVFRLSAKGIKRDFMSRVYQNRGQSNFQPRTAPNPASTVAPNLPSMGEHEAGLTLLQLANGQGNRACRAAQTMMSQTSPVTVSMTARGDVQLINGDNLASADDITLEAVLAQADALKQRVSKILEGRKNHAFQEKPDAELKALTPNSISHDDSTVVDELRLDPVSPHDTEKVQDLDDTDLTLDSAMHID